MKEILTFTPRQIAPAREDVLKGQGIPPEIALSDRVAAVYTEALRLLSQRAAPAGILRAISTAGFQAVYHGEGRNEPRTPVGDILSRATDLALFAITLGAAVSREIAAQFRANDPAVAAMLDSAASAAADKLAGLAAGRFREILTRNGRAQPATRVLPYSPGYCGWHISGQKKLFAYLRPERIGLSLGDSFLMQPLKSVSGVLLAGPPELHRFEDSYPFCRQCETRSCRERMSGRAAQ